jgi:hypothetical protein
METFRNVVTLAHDTSILKCGLLKIPDMKNKHPPLPHTSSTLTPSFRRRDILLGGTGRQAMSSQLLKELGKIGATDKVEIEISDGEDVPVNL